MVRYEPYNKEIRTKIVNKYMIQIKKIFKRIAGAIMVLTISSGLIFATPAKAACAQAPSPVMAVSLRANDQNDSPDAGWVKNLNTEGGHRVQFDVEIHNTVTGSTATNVTAKVAMPTGSGTTLSIPVTVTANNAAAATDTDTINIPGAGGTITYVPNSSRFTWSKNGNGFLDFDHAAIVDGLTSGGGIPLGDQNGCTAFIMKIEFLADVTGGTTPTPTPTPTPAPTGGTTNNNTNTNTNNNNININAAAAAPVVKTTPATGPELIPLMGMFGAGPVGFALSRYGRGTSVLGRKEEDWTGIAKDAFLERKVKQIS